MDHKQKVKAKYSKCRNFTPLNADSTDFQFSSVLVQHVVFTVYYLNRVMAEVNVILRIFFSDPKKVFFNVSLAL